MCIRDSPSSLHTLGFRAEQALTEARRNIAAALGAKEDEVFFTSGGTESNNLAIFGAAYARKRMGMHIVTTQIEHPSVTNAVRQLEKEGWEAVSYTHLDVYKRQTGTTGSRIPKDSGNSSGGNR